MRALQQGIDHILNNDLDFIIDYQRHNELGKLCSAFKFMRKELVRNNRYMWNLVEERRNINASISHDLRTPITVIKGYSEYLNKNKQTIFTKGNLQSLILVSAYPYVKCFQKNMAVLSSLIIRRKKAQG